MAAQVLSGNGNVSYTNSTGQNVRLVINYLEIGTDPNSKPVVTFPGCSITIYERSIYGKTLAYQSEVTGGTAAASDMMSGTGGYGSKIALPMEIAMANGDTFSINSSVSANIKGYNFIIIPEAG